MGFNKIITNDSCFARAKMSVPRSESDARPTSIFICAPPCPCLPCAASFAASAAPPSLSHGPAVAGTARSLHPHSGSPGRSGIAAPRLPSLPYNKSCCCRAAGARPDRVFPCSVAPEERFIHCASPTSPPFLYPSRDRAQLCSLAGWRELSVETWLGLGSRAHVRLDLPSSRPAQGEILAAAKPSVWPKMHLKRHQTSLKVG